MPDAGSGRRARALKAQAAIASVLAEDADALWPEDERVLESALNVVRTLGR